MARAESAPLVSIISLSNLDTEGCCFQLSYNYDGALGNIDALETRILTPNVLFSSVEFPLVNGWSYQEIQTQRRFRWEHNNGNIPLGEQTLSDFCFSGWNTSNPVELLVIWRQGNFVRQRDTIRIECTQCWEAQNPLVNCEPDSTYTYTFDYVNQSEFRVDYLQIREESGQDLVVEQNIPLAQSLLPGDIVTGIILHFRQGAVNLEELCFEITPRHLLHDTIAIECCTAEYCVPIPICDRCCTDYLIFEEELQQGFNLAINCDNMSVRLQANSLNECDRVRFEIIGLGAGVIGGDESITFGGLNEDISYEVCMTATRQNINGEDCYEEEGLEICETILFDCDDCFRPDSVDFDISCEPMPDFVCGCDSMTYLNSCVADNWGGLSSWEEGICQGTMPDSISCVGITINGDLTINLDWTISSTITLRYFLIERRSAVAGSAWETIDQVDASIFSFTDTSPLDPIGFYRIISVGLDGKVIISPDCFITATNELIILEGGRLYPNPIHQQLHIELPFSNQQYFEISNSTGQRIYQSMTNYQGKATISTPQWPSGYYFITAYIDHKTLWRKPFIIQH